MKKILLTLFAGLSTLQVSAQCWKQLDAGGYFTVGIKDDGTIWGWGYSWSGELGLTDSEYTSEPVQIGTDADWASVSAGNGHVMAVKTDGTLWAWGRNDCGQVGNGEISIYPNTAPIQIGTDSNWTFICAGHLHSTAIKENGTLWTWGYNASGQLGNGIIDDPNLPPQTIVPTQAGTDTNWRSISASWVSNAALKTDGTLWEWGDNAYVPLSNGATDAVASPIQVGTDTDWAIVSQGGFATSAIKVDGSLWSWGFNFSGGVGDGTNTDSTQPQLISGERWESVSRGMNYFAGAIKHDGTLWTWGYNYYGPLGDGTDQNKNSPTLIQSGLQWETYTGAGDFSVGFTKGGELSVWGYNYYNELGFELEGNTVLSPVIVQDCITAGIDDPLKGQFAIYPNPATTFLNLVAPDNTSIINVKINDVTGKTVVTQTGHTNQINVQQLPAGMYFIEIKTDTGTSHQKFIKE